jgi:hypothetical protein
VTSKVLELVVFKLNDGVPRDEFLSTNGPVTTWIAQQPGFVSRELAYDAEGDRWIDLIWWESMETAGAAAELALSSSSCAPMFALIDMESILMLHGEPAIAPVSAATQVAASA